MYFATDITEIVAAMEAKAPRPMREIFLEVYPDCTIDRNGRAHAPYDGYECLFTGKQFRAGEYLPFEFEDETFPTGSGRVRGLEIMIDGDVVFIEGTKAQVAAGREVIKSQVAAHDKTADFVGTVKKRETIELTLMTVFHEFGVYGSVYTHYMRDQSNNPVVYKGSKLMPMKAGETRKIKATVKSHWAASDGERKATYISRPVIE